MATKKTTKATKAKKPSTKKKRVEYISNPVGLIQPSVQALRLNIWLVVGAAVISAVVGIMILTAGITAVVLGLFGHSVGSVVLAAVVTLILLAVALAVLAPLSFIILLASARGKKLSLRQAVGQCWHYSGRMTLVILLTALATLGGLILLIIPGIIVGTWFSLAPYVLVDEDVGAIEAMKRSKRLVQGHLIEMLGLYGMDNFLSLFPLIGNIISLVLTLLTLASPAVRYLQLKELKSADEQPTPPVHWANWVVLTLAAISLVFGGYQGAQNVNQATQSGGATSVPTGP